MLRQFSRVLRASRRGLSTSTPSPRQAATAVWDGLIETDWVERETVEQERLVEQAESLLTAYRGQYKPESQSEGDAKEMYEQMRDLYQIKEAAQIVDLYADHIEQVMRDHEDMVGFLGLNTAIPEGGSDIASQTLHEYAEFVNGLENKEICKKVEHELGRKIIVLKMVLSAENFSTNFGSTAGGDYITTAKK